MAEVGMPNWFKRQRARAALDERKRSSVFGEKSRPVRMALSTIGADVHSREKETFVAESAAAISRYLCAASHGDLSDDETVYAVAVFAMVAADYLAQKLHARFEASAALSLAKLLQGRQDLGHIHDRVIDKFYVLGATKPTIVQSIRQSLDEWIDQPTRGNLDSLRRGVDELRAPSLSASDS
jgi:hypothetical protein